MPHFPERKVGLGLASELGIQTVAEPVAGQGGGHNDQNNQRRGDNGLPPLQQHDILACADHNTQRGVGGLAMAIMIRCCIPPDIW